MFIYVHMYVRLYITKLNQLNKYQECESGCQLVGDWVFKRQ